jgi:hypothetical protein
MEFKEEDLFVPLKSAKKLKEKDFYVPCMKGVKDGHVLTACGFSITNHSNMHDYALPLYQQVVDWFLETHDLDIQTHYNSDLTKKHQFQIHHKGSFCVVDSAEEFDTKIEMYNKAIGEALKLI